MVSVGVFRTNLLDTEEKVAAFKAAWRAGDSLEALGKAFGGSKSFPSLAAKRLGLTPRVTQRWQLPGALIEALYLDEKLTTEEIAERLRPKFPKVAHTTVRRVLLGRGVKLRPGGNPPTSNQLGARIVNLHRAGKCDREIAEALKIDDSKVFRHLKKRFGLRGKGKKPNVNVAAIKTLRQHGYSQQEIADKVGCSKGNVDYHLGKEKPRSTNQERKA